MTGEMRGTNGPSPSPSQENLSIGTANTSTQNLKDFCSSNGFAIACCDKNSVPYYQTDFG